MKKILLIMTISLLILSSVCFAAVTGVQSRPDRARLSITASDFFKRTRKMEAEGGVLGKSAVIDDDTGEETSSSNNIDAHMAKNTEYGAAAILAVSQFGYQTHTPEDSGIYTSATNYTLGDSTTGAEGTQSYYYGLFDMSNNYNKNTKYKYTYTATMHKDTTTSSSTYTSGRSTALYNAAHDDDLNKYVDYYQGNSTLYYYGDATTETYRWRGTSNASFVGGSNPVFLRYNGMFGFSLSQGDAYSYFSSRAVVVCGSGV